MMGYSRTETRQGAAVTVRVENLIDSPMGAIGTEGDRIMQIRDKKSGRILHRGHWYQDHMLAYLNKDGGCIDGYELWVEMEMPGWYLPVVEDEIRRAN